MQTVVYMLLIRYTNASVTILSYNLLICLCFSGDTFTCIAMVTNNGSDWLTEVSVADQPDCSYYLMLPGQTFNCSVIFTVNQTDFDNAEGSSKQITINTTAHPLSNTSSVVQRWTSAYVHLIIRRSLSITLDAGNHSVHTAGKAC